MHRRIKRPIFVACEGKSELGYVRWLNSLAGARGVPIAINGQDMKGGGPEAIANKAVRVLLRRAGGPAMYKNRFLLMDDGHTAELRQQMDRAQKIAKKNLFSIIWQHMSHECFLLKHFAETEDRSPPAADVCRAVLARLPQLGGHGDANPLIFRDRTPEGRHYRAADGKVVRTRSDGDPRRRLLRQGHAELVQQKLELLVRSGMARQDEVPAVGGR